MQINYDYLHIPFEKRDSPSGRDFGFILHLAKKLGWYEFVFDTAIQYHIILKTYCSSISSLLYVLADFPPDSSNITTP